jgi:hypothetical protein
MILTASFTPLFSAESVFKGNAGTNSKNMQQVNVHGKHLTDTARSGCYAVITRRCDCSILQNSLGDARHQLCIR